VLVIRAVVRHWYDDEGWGVADAPEAPGGIFLHFSFIDGEGYRSLREGEVVELRLEGPLPFDQDGCRWNGRSVRRLA
jgi:cold shock CspA family protein